MLVAALQVWLTNVIVFGLAYWELDRGGPVSRTQAPRELADGASSTSDWVPPDGRPGPLGLFTPRRGHPGRSR
jgi:hypothetical protein